MKNKLYIDLDKWPADAEPGLREVASVCNALVTKQEILEQEQELLKQDVDKISGFTPEEKEIMHKVMANVRSVGKWFHGKRLDMAVGSFQLCVFLYVIKQLGIKPDQVSQLVNAFIRILEKI